MNRTQVEQGPTREAATIRPPDHADLAALAGFFAGLSMRSRVQRFFAPIQPTAAMIRLACGWAGRDHGDNRAGGTDALVAVHGGVIIGHTMAVDRPADRPAGRTAPLEGRVTEIGVVVADAWQGQGVGSALVRALISRARARGVTSLSMDVLHTNQQVLAMIASHWTASRTRRATDCVTIQIPLPPEPRTVPPPAAAPPARRLVTSVSLGSGRSRRPLTHAPAGRSAAPAPATRPGRPPRPR